MNDLAAAAPPPRITTRQVAAAVIGNGLEFYDFTTYAFFAVQIGHSFFPNVSPFSSLMASLATFGAGFVLRPIGSVLIGRYADRHGRRPAMLFSFTMMGVAILGLALTPSYARIGVAAPVLVVLWRLMQGFALGGEVGPTTAYLIEAAPPARRGLYGAWQSGSQNIAGIVGGLVGVGLAQVAGPQALEGWGWRAAFLLGAAMLPLGIVIRRNLPETLHRAEAPAAAHPAEATVVAHGRIIFLGVALILGGTVTTYAFNFMTTFARAHLHMSAAGSLGATLVNGAFGLAGVLIGGTLSDRFGRRALMIWPRVVLIVIALPAYMLMVRNHDVATLFAATAVLSFVSNMTQAAVIVAITESLRKEIRGAVMGAIYATSVAVFGGTTQLAIEGLIHVTGNPLTPAWYVIAASLIALVASVMMKETAHGRGPRTP